MEQWYPEKLGVGPDGTPRTYQFMKGVYAQDAPIKYAEFGIYLGDTARNVAEMYPNAEIHLFDYGEQLDRVKYKFERYGNRVHYHPCTQKYMDSYNWNLINIIGTGLKFDYCFIDGPHSVAVDALTFFLCDKVLNIGGYVDFDDYDWNMRGSSVDPTKVSETAMLYTDEQIDAYQIKMVVDKLVKTDTRYETMIGNKIYKKIG